MCIQQIDQEHKFAYITESCALQNIMIVVGSVCVNVDGETDEEPLQLHVHCISNDAWHCSQLLPQYQGLWMIQ